MDYVRRILQPGEEIRLVTRMHPLIFLSAMLWGAGAVVLAIAGLSQSGDTRTIIEAVALLCLVFCIAAGLPAAIRRQTTELAVTDRRVIYKSGVIARHTLEMNLSKVESVDVDQSLLGRVFGFGTIIVRGTGGSLEPIRMISNPLIFRSHITAG